MFPLAIDLDADASLTLICHLKLSRGKRSCNTYSSSYSHYRAAHSWSCEYLNYLNPELNLRKCFSNDQSVQNKVSAAAPLVLQGRWDFTHLAWLIVRVCVCVWYCSLELLKLLQMIYQAWNEHRIAISQVLNSTDRHTHHTHSTGATSKPAYPSLCLSSALFISLSVHFFLPLWEVLKSRLPFCLSICLSIHMWSIHPNCRSVYPPVFPSVSLSNYYIWLSVIQLHCFDGTAVISVAAPWDSVHLQAPCVSIDSLTFILSYTYSPLSLQSVSVLHLWLTLTIPAFLVGANQKATHLKSSI